MHKFLIRLSQFLLLSMLSASSLHSETAGETISRDELQSMYVTALNELNLNPQIDGDGDVVFEDGELTFYMNVEATMSDLHFFQVVLPGIWTAKSRDDVVAVSVAMSQTNEEIKFAKLYLHGDQVHVSVERFVESPADFRDGLEVQIESAKAAALAFMMNLHALDSLADSQESTSPESVSE